MQQSPWEARSHSASQEILWNPKVRYLVHNNPPLVPILNHMHLVYNLPSYFPKIHSNIIFPSTTRFSKRSLPFRFSDQNIVRLSHPSYVCYMSRPSHILDLITLIIFSEAFKLRTPHCAVFSILPFLPTLHFYYVSEFNSL